LAGLKCFGKLYSNCRITAKCYTSTNANKSNLQHTHTPAHTKEKRKKGHFFRFFGIVLVLFFFVALRLGNFFLSVFFLVLVEAEEEKEVPSK